MSAHRLLGPPRASRATAEVQVLFEPPAVSYQAIAMIEASSRGSWALGLARKENVVIERLRREAAAVGADAVLLQELGDQPLQSVTTSMGVASEGPRGTVDLGIGAAHLFTRAYGRGLAIVRGAPASR